MKAENAESDKNHFEWVSNNYTSEKTGKVLTKG